MCSTHLGSVSWLLVFQFDTWRYFLLHYLAVLVILIANVLRKEDIRTVKWPQSVTLGYNATSYFLRKPLACSIQLNLNLFLFNPFSLAFVPYAEVGESHFYKNHRNVLFLNRETYWYKF